MIVSIDSSALKPSSSARPGWKSRGKRAGKPRTNEAGGAGDDGFHAVPGDASRAGIGSADLI